MNKLIALGLMALSMNTAFAADGTYASTLDMTRSEGNQVKAERVESEPVLEGRNEASNGGIQFPKNVDQNQPIQLTGRRD
ncbi:hypothetical protein AB4455_20720 [Vibrio sp. 10N.261.46.E12]|uniref:hypothetical protein n=1 Tax=unclassified Vibrio TaxID=2614977 RepID=UPI000977C252|nr:MULTISPECIES: hypothetical protein [unclassified Vibrio]OMO34768.1 hypothetical protein BH584_12050 [Vibrio sp. 10N.261.45.E1]PMJ25219.1 hypothetical protein BCU27_11530 [Vibrio sp. 10N.286.45.B6]PML83568.1 hypothetical protein BCT66_18920 [Vibrio sp. 10N.261.49.E11]PMM67841.1 hypothetical protein BCT48_13995 [Vibrio sp. 10N.261.46.F12]PMM88465.1 hypothetical protein BCT46_04780 [Vibrio sp. 10N.261.46.E8]